MKKIMISSIVFSMFYIQLNSATPLNKHIVKKGETLYSLSRKYGVSVADISRSNHFSTKYELKIGQQILIPANGSNNKAITYKPVYVPGTPDTPYRDEDIRPRSANLLKAETSFSDSENKTTVSATTESKTNKVADGNSTVSSNATEYPDIFNRYAANGYKIKKDKGAANYLSDITAGNQHLAFFNGASTGSVIRVTNLMNKKTVFVKVIGKVPPGDAGNDITVKLSNTAAKHLGVMDEKFLVEVASYSMN